MAKYDISFLFKFLYLIIVHLCTIKNVKNMTRVKIKGSITLYMLNAENRLGISLVDNFQIKNLLILLQ